MNIPADDVSAGWTPVALKIVTDIAARLGQTDALACLPENQLRELVDAVS